METKIAIAFPCYNQPELLLEALGQLNKSEIKIKKIIKDDCSPRSYLHISSNKRWSDLIYLKNQKNLGAINNMISCFFIDTPEEYIMCHHEDDLLHKDFLKISQETLDNNPSLAFVASQSLSFRKIDDIAPQGYPNAEIVKMNKSELICYFANNNNLAFGSVVYRKKYLSKQCIDLEKYAMLFDRPFLAELLNDNLQGVIIKAPLYFYRHHPYPDNRWKGLKIQNIYNLYKYYKQEKKAKVLSRYFFDFANLDNKTIKDYLFFIKSLSRLNLKILFPNIKSFKFIMAGLFVLLFGKKNYQLSFERIKHLKK